MQTDIAIIGAGPVGLFSVFQAGMLGMRSCVIDALDVIGGQCSVLYPEKPIYDIPAYPEILAIDLIRQLEKQAALFKPTYLLGQQVVSLTQENGSFRLTTSKGQQINAKVVVVAAGCGAFGPNKPPLARLEEFEGKSIFYLVNRRADFVGKKIVIAGGGDSAIDWAISLSEIAEKIYLVHRRDKFRAAPESMRQIHQLVLDGKIELVVPYQLDALEGQEGILSEVKVKDLDGNSKSLAADILLPFYGLATNLGPISDWGLGVHLHHIEVKAPYFQTNIEGIYAVGDIAHYPGKLKLILTGFAECASSLHHAYSRVFDGKALHFEYSTTKGIS